MEKVPVGAKRARAPAGDSLYNPTDESYLQLRQARRVPMDDIGLITKVVASPKLRQLRPAEISSRMPTHAKGHT